MTRRMLIDATHAEETRVAVVDGTKLVDFDYESKVRKQLKGSIFLAKVTRVEPSLQAAFVNFGGNRHGFLPFTEVHPDYFRIPIADREALIAEQEREMQARMEEEEAEDSEEADKAEAEGENEGESESEDQAEEDRADEEQAEAQADEEQAEEEAEAAPGNVIEEIVEAEDDSIGNTIEPEGTEVDGNREGAHRQGREHGHGRDREHGGGGRDGRRGRRGRGGRNRDRGGRGGHGRHGGGGRGGRDRMAAHSRRVEIVGGDGIEGDQPMRPSLRKNYKIQEVIKRGQIMLVQVSKEERGNKGAAVSTYLSLPGRYCVLMPNSPRAGGVSRKIANFKERKRMREILNEFKVPQGMSVIMRTAGVSRTKTEIKRDLDYLMKLWDNIRELTLESTAPALVHEEGNLVRRSIRDIYSREIEEIVVSGDEGYKLARDFMKMMIPSHVKRVKEYDEKQIPLFNRYQVESQISEIGDPVVTLPSGGYIVINPTEALVSIDVNSGKATKERHIEETALRTNLEAAEEVARQLRLRDLGGLVVVDFIDMEDRRNNRKVEQRMKDALSTERARIQIGRISSFGLMELSRQRLNPSLTEAQFEKCPHCEGIGYVKTVDAAAINALRALEEEGIRNRAKQVILHVSGNVAVYLLNNKRHRIAEIEARYGFIITVHVNEALAPSRFEVEAVKTPEVRTSSDDDESAAPAEREKEKDRDRDRDSSEPRGHGHGRAHQGHGQSQDGQGQGEGRRRRGRRGGRRRGGRFNNERGGPEASGNESGNGGEGENKGRDHNHNRDRNRDRPHHHRDRNEPRDGERHGHREKQDRSEWRERSERPERQREEQVAEPREEAPAASPAADTVEEAKQTHRGRRHPAREEVPQEQVLETAAAPSNDVAPKVKDYETVNEPPGEKKKGWWNRLTE